MHHFARRYRFEGMGGADQTAFLQRLISSPQVDAMPVATWRRSRMQSGERPASRLPQNSEYDPAARIDAPMARQGGLE
jgi:hypothetical protein